MRYTVERLSNEPIIVVVIGTDYAVGKHFLELAQLVDSKVGKDETGVYAIFDITEMKMSFGDLVIAMSNQSQKAPGALADPRLNTLIVGSGDLVKLGIQAFQQEQYGNLNFRLFTSVDEALKYAREELKKRG